MNDQVKTMTEQEYMEQRVANQIEWYDTKSGFNKRWFLRLKIAEIIVALLIPLLTGYITPENLDPKMVVGILGVVVAAAAGIITLCKFQENWIQYRTVAETLKHEKFLFATRSGPYKDGEAFALFVE